MSDSPDPTPIALPVGEMSIDHYVALITSCLQGWTSLSVAVWNRLTDHRLTKVYHCKHTNSSSEHECVICEFVDELGNKLVLRMDRHVGAHRHTVDVGSSSISSPPSSRSLSSVNEKSSKASFSSLHGSISFPSDIISDRYLAKDTISRIQGHPPGYEALRTITFNGDRSLRPSLWDVAILVLVVHKDSPFYNLHARQCYWFADTIFAALEKWAVIRKNGTVMHDEAKQGRRRASTGSRRDVIVHRRKSEKIAKIWDDFEKKLDVMTQQKEYERVRTEEMETTKRHAEQVKQLMLDLAKDNGEWEERDKQLRKEEEKRDQRHQEEKRALKRELARLQRKLQQMNRDLQTNAPVTRRRGNQGVASNRI